MKRYIGAGHTALTLKNASRINPLTDNYAAPTEDFVPIDDTNGNSVDCMAFRNDILLIVKNTSGSNALTVTQTAYVTVSGIVLPNEATVIPFGEEAYIGPINDGNMLDGNIARFSYTGTTPTGKVMAMRVSQSNV